MTGSHLSDDLMRVLRWCNGEPTHFRDISRESLNAAAQSGLVTVTRIIGASFADYEEQFSLTDLGREKLTGKKDSA